ncbi:BadF/BadG/BcrA/BcrD ATPase family protein [Streptosporangium sp. NPDC051023]|uniref:N-acetylglucosamine kinase n=1 Tax=Streptosporangium sp. NPDC051023 TaxID=3155410 RepID=UPI00344FC9BB
MTRLVIGVDGGGTSTRCVLATESGEVVGRGYGGAANALSATDPGGSLRAALLAALGGLDPARVAGGVLGLAGADSAPERAEAVAAEAWCATGLAGRPEVVPDMLVAFAGATREPSGAVLVAGTGAVAARIEDRRVVRRADGYGWLLGDEGSGAWIGLRAVRAALASLDGRAGPTALCEAVLGDPAPRDASIRWIVGAVGAGVAEDGPSWLARLAPAVESAARAGDETAAEILREAALRLTRTVLSLGPGPGPLVLAGSLLTGPTLLAARVRAGLPGTVVTARDGAAGAAALALHALSPRACAAHLRLIARDDGPARA